MLICTYCERQVPRPQITAIKSEREKNLAEVDNFFWILYFSFLLYLLALFIAFIFKFDPVLYMFQTGEI